MSSSFRSEHHNDNLEDEDEASTQLQSELRASITQSLCPTDANGARRRPILTHLNADTTWLLSIPIPPPPPSPPAPVPAAKEYHSPYPQRSSYKSPYSQPPPLSKAGKEKQKREGGGKGKRKHYFHILIDPWLRGPQSDVAAFFSTQWHAEPSACQTIDEVEEWVRDIERDAIGMGEKEGERDREAEETLSDEEKAIGSIDAVVVSHEFTDHMHKDTLLEIRSKIPVYATAKAAGIVRSWKHFEVVREIGRFGGDWRMRDDGDALPSWLGISRLAYPGLDLLYYHSAILITFSSILHMEEQAEAEAVLYTPHGISPSLITPLTTASPSISTLALLHGLQDISINTGWLGGVAAQLNKGAHNGLKVQRLLGARYWTGTHDEVKKGGGMVSWWLKRKLVSLEEAMRMAEGEEGEEEEKRKGSLEGVRFVEVGNGEMLVLE